LHYDNLAALAETFRRGVEQLLEVYPEEAAPAGDWHPPAARDLGWRGVSAAEMHRLAQADMESAGC